MDLLGHFYVENTSDARTLEVRIFQPSLLQLDDAVLDQGRALPGSILLSGKVRAEFLMVTLSRGNERIRSVIRVRDGRFHLRLALRFGPGAYRINLFAAGRDGLSFKGLAGITVSNTSAEDCRFRAPSPAIQSDAPRIIRLMQKITRGEAGDPGRLRAVYRWVTGNIRYDYRTLFSGTFSHKTSLEVLDSKLDICEGYAKLTAALLRAAGIRSRIIHGQAFSRALGNRWLPHAWNQAWISGRWVDLDTTWDAGFLRRGKVLVPRPWKYFMPAAGFFRMSHRLEKVSLE